MTDNQSLLPILRGFEKVEVILLGGYYNRDTETTVGGQACKDAGNYVADLYLMGTCAIDSAYGVTAAVREDGEVKQAMMEVSLKIVALSSKEKLGSTDHFKVCSMNGVDVLITDLINNYPLLKEFQSRDLEII